MDDKAHHPLDYAMPTTMRARPVAGPWGRLPTTIALAGILTVVLLNGILWVTAISRGNLRAISQHYDSPPALRGNHGPWRHHRDLRDLSGYATMLTIGVLPLAGIGALIEQSRRTAIVVILAMLMLIVNCAHFPLFD